MRRHKKRLPMASACICKRCGRASRSEEKRTLSRHFSVRAAVVSRGPALARQGLGLNDCQQLVLRTGASATYDEPSEFQAFSIERARLLQWSEAMTANLESI
jgi:hypothetical protein